MARGECLLFCADSFSQERLSASLAAHSHTLCCFLEEENQRSTELLHSLDGHIHHLRAKAWESQPRQPSRVLAPAPAPERFLAH